MIVPVDPEGRHPRPPSSWGGTQADDLRAAASSGLETTVLASRLSTAALGNFAGGSDGRARCSIHGNATASFRRRSPHTPGPESNKAQRRRERPISTPFMDQLIVVSPHLSTGFSTSSNADHPGGHLPRSLACRWPESSDGAQPGQAVTGRTARHCLMPPPISPIRALTACRFYRERFAFSIAARGAPVVRDRDPRSELSRTSGHPRSRFRTDGREGGRCFLRSATRERALRQTPEDQ